MERKTSLQTTYSTRVLLISCGLAPSLRRLSSVSTCLNNSTFASRDLITTRILVIKKYYSTNISLTPLHGGGSRETPRVSPLGGGEGEKVYSNPDIEKLQIFLDNEGLTGIYL
jgi:hypothetical protein